MTTYDYDIGIIGGGAAGLTVAAGASQLGAKTLLVEREPRLGGDCLHYGCVPSKTLIKSAKVYHLMRHAQRYGLPAVDVPPVDFSRVRERIREVIGIIQHHDSEERFCGLGAKVVFGAAAFSDDHTVRIDDGPGVTARSWVIATGSSAARPPIPGLDRTPVLTNRELFEMDRLPASLIVLGAGPIGAEMSQAFARLGTRVTVVDQGHHILPREDHDLADAVRRVLESEGVDFKLGCTIEEVRDLGHGREVRVRTADRNELRLTAEAVLVALGRSANTAGLGLEAIGVAHDRRGISVDSRMRTSRKHIFAAGDVAGGPQFTHAAGYGGGIVVSNAVIHLPRKADFTWLPHCTFTDPPLASIGMNETAAKAAGVAYTLWTEEFQSNDRSLAEGEGTGRIKMLLNSSERPIGVQILGANAGDLIAEWVAVLNGKVKLATLAAAVHPYPTVAEINKRVAGNVFSEKIFSEKVRKGLKFIFQFKGRACTLPEETTP
ncbi:MAG TPA: FAD-dependent oxidoreductase [Desulfobacterales bacterium]|nr:FAD-dependent oxidoreductase [Desulfobacterales bacterium]